MNVKLNFVVLMAAGLMLGGCLPEPPVGNRIEIAKSRQQITKSLLSTYGERLGSQLPNAEFELRVSQRSEPISIQAASTLLGEAEKKLSGQWTTLTASNEKLVSSYIAPKGTLTEIGDQIDVELHHLRGVPRCDVTVNGTLTSSELNNEAAKEFRRDFVAGKTNWRTLTNLNVDASNLKPREMTYAIGRILGSSADDDWRYFQSASVMFYSRRVAVSAVNAMSLQIATSPEVSPSNVALRLTRKSTGANAGVIDLGPPSERNLEVSEAGHRYNISEQLRARNLVGSDGAIDAEIVEIVVQFSGIGINQAIAKKALRSVRVQSSDAIFPNASSLAFKETGLLAGQSLWYVPLRPLLANSNFDVKVSRLTVAVNPPSMGSCAVRVESVRIVDRYDGHGPYYAVNQTRQVTARGAALFPGQTEYDGTRLPTLQHLAYVPLTQMIVERGAQRGIEKSCGELGVEQIATKDGGFLKYAEFSGGHISSCDGFRLTQEKDGATRIQLREGSAQITIPISSQSAESAYLFFVASADQTTDSRSAVTASATIVSRGKTSKSFPLPFQQAIELSGLDGTLNLVVRLATEVPMSSIVVHRIEVFKPTMVDHAESFALRTPEFVDSDLRSKGTPRSYGSEVLFSNAAAGDYGVVTGLIDLDIPIVLPQTSLLTVSISPDFVPEDECWISIKPIWGERRGDAYSVCGHSAGIVRPLPRALLRPPIDSVTNPLSGLEVTVRARRLPNSAPDSKLQMAVVGKLSGIGYVSARDMIQRSKLFAIADDVRSTLRPEINGVAAIARGLTSVKLKSTNLSDSTLTQWMETLESASGGLQIRNLAIVNPNAAVDAAVWQRTLNPIVKPKSTFFKWLGFGFIATVAGIVAVYFRFRQRVTFLNWSSRTAILVREVRDRYISYQPTLLTALSWLCVIAASIGSGWKAARDPAWPQATVFGGALLAGWLLLPTSIVRARALLYSITALVYSSWAVSFAVTKSITEAAIVLVPVFPLVWSGSRVVLAAGTKLPLAVARVGLPLFTFVALMVASILATEPLTKSNLATYAAICIAIGLARFLHEGWSWFAQFVPQLTKIKYLADRSGKYGLVSILALLTTGGFVSSGHRPLAEYCAMVAYFAMWGMFFHRLLESYKTRANTIEKNRANASPTAVEAAL